MPHTRRVVDASQFPPLRPVPGYLAVVDFVRREISLGRLLPGDRLPAERRLAEQLGVARETLRQALRVLEGGGFLSIERGANGGAVILADVVDDAVLRSELRTRKDSLVQLIEYRAEIESSAARLAATKRTDADVDAMRAAQAELSGAEDKDVSRSADTAFHLAVATAAGNPFLLQAVEDARATMFFPVDLATFEFVKETSHRGHEAVLRAIADRDPDAAAAAMREHVEQTRVDLMALIDAE
ncbi:FadR/GntR family transcriptional regulator [Microbacterium trichothecenolyticum]|nr:FCD domain-containing protein [Microbacterium trichothecenolyticum]